MKDKRTKLKVNICLHANILFIPCWHSRISQKAGGNGLGFYRIAPMLYREAELIQMAVESEDLERGGNARCLRRKTGPPRH